MCLNDRMDEKDQKEIADEMENPGPYTILQKERN